MLRNRMTPMARPRRRPLRRAVRAVAAFVLGLGLVWGLAPAAGADPQIDEWWLTRLGVSAAWELSRGEGVVVAVVDSGVVDSVPQLRGQVLPGYDAYDGSTDGRTDPSPSRLAPGFTSSHGTEMAMLIAGRADSNVAGIAPEARILPVRVGVPGDVPAAATADGIRWAVDHGASIVNLSLHVGSFCDSTEADAVAYAYRKGVIVVAAAGNTPGPVNSPADCPGAVAVTATDTDFAPWPENATGPEVAFTAPGVDLLLPTLEGDTTANSNGTSAAAAVVSGVFALLRARFPDAPARDLVTRALYNASNGVEGVGITRMSDRQGYGAPLPGPAMQYALTGSEQNPIYDAFDRELAASASTAPGSPSPGQSGPVPGAGGGGAADGSGSGGSSTGLLVGVGLGVGVIAVLLAVVAVRSSRRSRGAEPVAAGPWQADSSQSDSPQAGPWPEQQPGSDPG